MRGKVVYIVSTFVLLALILYLFAPLINFPRQSRAEVIDLQAFTRIIFLYNLSIVNMEKSFYTSVLENASQVLESISENLDELSKIEKNIDLGYSELGDTIFKAVKSYREIGLASKLVLNASILLSRVVPKVSLALNLLLECRVDEGLSLWNQVKDDFKEVKELLKGSLEHLANVKEDDLLSKNHRMAYEKGVEEISETLQMLQEVEKAFKIVKEHSKAFEELCKARKEGRNPNLDKSVLQQLAQKLSKLNPGKARKFGYEIALLKSFLKSCQCTSKGGKSGGKGQGAGYVPPSSDD